MDALKWDLSAITPHDFVEQLLPRLPIESRDRITSVKRHAQTFIAMCTAGEFQVQYYASGLSSAGYLSPRPAHGAVCFAYYIVDASYLSEPPSVSY